MTNPTLAVYLDGLYQMYRIGKINYQQMLDMADVFVHLVEEDGFTLEHSAQLLDQVWQQAL